MDADKATFSENVPKSGVSLAARLEQLQVVTTDEIQTKSGMWECERISRVGSKLHNHNTICEVPGST